MAYKYMTPVAYNTDLQNKFAYEYSGSLSSATNFSLGEWHLIEIKYIRNAVAGGGRR